MSDNAWYQQLRMDEQPAAVYTSRPMNLANLRRLYILLGHLLITVPIIAAIPAMIRFGLYMFGPDFYPYYVTAAMAIGWQWYSVAVPLWEKRSAHLAFEDADSNETARRVGLVWPGASTIGPFAVHTTAAAICAMNIGPWLAGRWFHLAPLLLGSKPQGPGTDYYLQHLELANVVAGLLVGYLISLKFRRLGTWAWILPTAILSYKLLTFTGRNASVLVASDLWSRFSYYFVIERVMPTFYNLRGDPARVVAQITVVAPFYSAIAYSIGALAQRHEVVERIMTTLRRQRETELLTPDTAEPATMADETASASSNTH
jgi:hypothetical protein